MVYLYKKTINEKHYYYLRISKKIKNKTIVKDVAYLGNDASKIQKRLDDLPKKYQKDIKKTYRNIKKHIESEYFLKKAKKLKLKKSEYLDKEIIEQIEAIRLHYKEIFLKLDKSTKKDIFKNFLIDFAFNTTSIEGNTISLAETQKLLTENLTPKNKTLREIYDLQNTEKLFFDLIDSKARINNKLIINIHDKLMQNIDLRKGYRKHDVRVFRSRFDSSPAKYVKIDINILLNWFKKNKKKFHPLVFISLFHQKFERIHPFAEGNGRTGRMMMNYMLIKNKFPPIIIRNSKRSEYLDALAKADNTDINNNNSEYFKKMVNFIAKELIDNYWNSFLV